MAGTMSQADLVVDLKESLQDAAKLFVATNDADFIRHLTVAALDMARKRPRTLLGTFTLEADQDNYAAPADFVSFKSDLWGIGARKYQPWDANYPGRLPDVSVAGDVGAQVIYLSPAPTAFQIGVLGSAYKFYYYAAHSISATAASTTIKAADRGLLLLRAQAEAMKEMAMRNIGKPVSMRDGLSQGPRNGTPSFLFETLMQQFEGAM